MTWIHISIALPLVVLLWVVSLPLAGCGSCNGVGCAADRGVYLKVEDQSGKRIEKFEGTLTLDDGHVVPINCGSGCGSSPVYNANGEVVEYRGVLLQLPPNSEASVGRLQLQTDTRFVDVVVRLEFRSYDLQDCGPTCDEADLSIQM